MNEGNRPVKPGENKGEKGKIRHVAMGKMEGALCWT